MGGEDRPWENSGAYDRFMGRWSRPLADRFVAWVAPAPGSAVIDVGCGTGALSEALVRGGAGKVTGVDRSPEFVAQAAAAMGKDGLARFRQGDATATGEPTGAYDAALSGLVINFVDRPDRMVGEMARVTRPGGTIAICVWDYAGKMEMLRVFWDAACELDPARAAALDEGRLFPLCQPGPLGDLLRNAGLSGVRTAAIEVPTVFASFDDYWSPFTDGSGPAQRYVVSLGNDGRDALRDSLRGRLVPGAGGAISLVARAWVAAGSRP